MSYYSRNHPEMFEKNKKSLLQRVKTPLIIGAVVIGTALYARPIYNLLNGDNMDTKQNTKQVYNSRISDLKQNAISFPRDNKRPDTLYKAFLNVGKDDEFISLDLKIHENRIDRYTSWKNGDKTTQVATKYFKNNLESLKFLYKHENGDERGGQIDFNDKGLVVTEAETLGELMNSLYQFKENSDLEGALADKVDDAIEQYEEAFTDRLEKTTVKAVANLDDGSMTDPARLHRAKGVMGKVNDFFQSFVP